MTSHSDYDYYFKEAVNRVKQATRFDHLNQFENASREYKLAINAMQTAIRNETYQLKKKLMRERLKILEDRVKVIDEHLSKPKVPQLSQNVNSTDVKKSTENLRKVVGILKSISSDPNQENPTGLLEKYNEMVKLMEEAFQVEDDEQRRKKILIKLGEFKKKRDEIQEKSGFRFIDHSAPSFSMNRLTSSISIYPTPPVDHQPTPLSPTVTTVKRNELKEGIIMIREGKTKEEEGEHNQAFVLYSDALSLLNKCLYDPSNSETRTRMLQQTIGKVNLRIEIVQNKIVESSIPTISLPEQSITRRTTDSETEQPTQKPEKYVINVPNFTEEEEGEVKSPEENKINLSISSRKEFLIDIKELRLLKRISRGGFGTIHLARWSGSGGGSIVVVKEIPLVDEVVISREMSVIFRLSFPHVANFYGYSIPEDKLSVYLVMEKCDGDLQTLLETSTTPFTLERKFIMMLKMVKSVHYLHSRKILHRDLKLKNFLHRNDGSEIKITDFGMVKITEEIQDTFVYSGLRGTPRYVSRELLDDRGNDRKCEKKMSKYSIYSDIWSLGMCFYHLLAEIRPYFHIKKDLRVMLAILRKELPDLEVRIDPVEKIHVTDHQTIPEDFKSLLREMWDFDPLARPDTGELLDWFKEKQTRYVSENNKII